MALSITHTPVYCTDLDEALAFYTQRLGFEVRDDVPMGPEMRWLTVHAPGDDHDLLLAAVDHHIPPADRQARLCGDDREGGRPACHRVGHLALGVDRLRGVPPCSSARFPRFWLLRAISRQRFGHSE